MRTSVSPLVSRIAGLILLVAVVGVGGLLGYFIYSAAKNAVVHAQVQLPDPPSIAPVDLTNRQQASANASEDIGEKRASPLAAAMDKPESDRINLLLLGLDVPDGGEEPARTDTIIVVSVDPVSHDVSMLSIPRDLWVPIGPYGENRINTAYFLGETRSNYPGGGIGLLRATIEQSFGIPIDYYVCVDFNGFERLLDELGGVTIEVEQDIYDTAYPDGEGGTRVVSFSAGMQHMDGETALEYARTRHGNSDFDRARRQQQLLMTIYEQALENRSVTDWITKLPALSRVFYDTVETDLSLDDMVRLARIADTIDISSLDTAVIDQTMTQKYITDDGWDVLLPINEKIEPLIDRLFRAPSRANVNSSQYELEASPEVQSENASILIANGSGRPGLEVAAKDYLVTQGFRVVGSSALQSNDYGSSVVVVYTDKPATVAALVSALNLTSQQMRLSTSGPNPEEVDIKVILGQDFALPAD